MKLRDYSVHVIFATWILLYEDSAGQDCPSYKSTVVKVCHDDWASDARTVYLDTSSAPTYCKAACPCSVSSEYHRSITVSFTPGSNTETVSFDFRTANITGLSPNGLFAIDERLEFWYRSSNDHRTLPACLKISVNGGGGVHDLNLRKTPEKAGDK
ncbi:hypothetical protein MAR_004159 [Mya arenaria]|uniref:Uncharacterized protein n=1 Tax=Mya arenaria TaxID=6604 RepID=A0ABY7EY86_MYAAR|nr:hypothetical protein MAR_004159 [Mya arenaria]